MTVREIRAAARFVGRRTALRYLALGAGAALLSACTGKDKPTAPPPAAASPSPSPSPPAPTAAAASGVVGRAFAEFVKGSWEIRSTLPGENRKDTGRAAVRPDGTWTIVWSGIAGTWTGRWSLHRGRLDLQVLSGPQHLTDPDIATSVAEKVPDTVKEDSLALQLPWYPMGAQDVFGRLEIAYNGTELRIRHMDPSGTMSIHMCTRT
ncbi:hypothetical protein [Streptomyces sp. A1547]|uniref:hypothetical protein n=1 Tax=Streptomyces sp. A1547 TaxID=2563105 RepID=UPI00061E608D|nr:hypothetical protein [Streptomyces sp. A1547]KJY45911.1 hypothetical protein VR46_12100 [Streptomyces sp. NRRL S-444]THA37264.1 hypothetical protein E6W17_20860 [Streptomyces sp. A1547]